MYAGKTVRMLQIERDRDEPIDTLLARLLREKNTTDAAKDLGVSRTILYWWVMRLDIRVLDVLVSEGDDLVIRGRN